MTLLAAFSIPGPPVPKGRARVVRGHAFTPKKTRDAEERIGQHFFVKYPHMQPATCRLRVVARFYIKGTRGDGDNFLKCLLDAGNKRIWADDKLVDEITVSVIRSSAEPRTSVEVWEL